MPWWVPVLLVACLAFAWWAAGAMNRMYERQAMRKLDGLPDWAAGRMVTNNINSWEPPMKMPAVQGVLVPQYKRYGFIEREFVHPTTGVSQRVRYGTKPHIRLFAGDLYCMQWTCSDRSRTVWGRSPADAYDQWHRTAGVDINVAV